MHINPLRAVASDRLALTGFAILSAIVLMAILAPVLTFFPPDYYTGQIFSPPSTSHPLGTDSMGQDIWSRLLFGARTTLLVAASVAILSTSLSVLVGASSAFIGGLYECFWMRFVDAMSSIPPIIVMILIAAYIRPNLLVMILLLSTLSWPGGARIIRSQVLSLKERGHVYASRTFGASWGHILKSHIAPELGPLLTAMMIQDARSAVFMEAGMGFLGVSDPMIISWGKMIQQALEFTYLDVWKWWLLPTGLALSLTLVGLCFIGFSLEAAMDPRLMPRSIEGDGEKC
ncbi:MAG: ABC transporter permease [Methanothrix sp.]